MSGKVTMRLEGCHFKHEYGETKRSHSGTPGVRLTIADGSPVYLDYEQCALIAKTIGRLYGSSSDVTLQVAQGGADA